jgi:hypothetical protein
MLAEVDSTWLALVALGGGAFTTLLGAVRWLAISNEKRTIERIAELRERIDELQKRCDACEADRILLWKQLRADERLADERERK